MKTLFGVFGLLLVIGGIALGVYVGVWVMAVGGIIQFIDGIKADPVCSADIAWGVVRFFLASVAGVFSAIIPVFIGKTLVDSS